MTATSEDSATWFRRYREAEPGAVQIVCLPHAGGSASYFMPLVAALSPTYDVACVQYPGRQDRHREPPVGDIDTLADRLFEALVPDPTRPLVLFGHSMGAVLGFELARRIERHGGSVLGLIASGRRAPHLHRVETVHQKDDDGLIAEIRQLSGTDPGALNDEEVLRMILPALRADYRAIETYRHELGEPLRTPISALIGESDPRVTLDEAQAWKSMTATSFQFRSFPGGHFYLNNQQAAVTRAITESIAAFQIATPPVDP